jgi:hypothetical protein
MRLEQRHPDRWRHEVRRRTGVEAVGSRRQVEITTTIEAIDKKTAMVTLKAPTEV